MRHSAIYQLSKLQADRLIQCDEILPFDHVFKMSFIVPLNLADERPVVIDGAALACITKVSASAVSAIKPSRLRACMHTLAAFSATIAWERLSCRRVCASHQALIASC